MGKRYPKEFRDDVVRVARSSDAPIKQIAEDFGISDASLYNWLKQADIDDGRRQGVTSVEADEMTAMKKRVRCWSRRTRSCAVPQRPLLKTSAQNDVPAGP